MRDYSKISGQFWIGKTGKALRGDVEAQLVAMYLMTNNHANMIGIYHCPIIYIAHETGLPLEGALKGIQRLTKEGFCTYEDDSEIVWVHEMAKFQIGDELKATDNQVKSVRKQYEALHEGVIKQGFAEKYGDAYKLVIDAEEESPSEAPSKPLRSQKQEQKQEQNNSSASPDGFAVFWSAYPKKKSKGDAEKAWKRIKPDAELRERINSSLEAMKASNDWTKEGGQFIPHPATWLNAKGWEDEISSPGNASAPPSAVHFIGAL